MKLIIIMLKKSDFNNKLNDLINDINTLKNNNNNYSIENNKIKSDVLLLQKELEKIGFNNFSVNKSNESDTNINN